MQVTKEQIDPCKMALTISVEPGQVRVARDKAFAQFAKNVTIPGFRKGKVPPQMARSYVDEARVKQRAAELLVSPSYAEALQETEVEPFAGLSPELEMVDFPDDGPFVFKAFVPLRPVVTLGPYKGLDVEHRKLLVTDADVDRQLEELRARYAEYPEITDRPAEMGDILLADLTVTIEDQDVPELAAPRSTVIEIGKNIGDFDNGLVGMSIGDTKTIDAHYPDNFADEKLRGKAASFVVTVKEMRSRILPEMNEEFLQKVRPGVESEEALRTSLKETLEMSAVEMSDNDLEFTLVGKIVDNSQVFFPDALLRAEMQSDINELNERLKRENASFEQYMAAVGKNQRQIEAEMADAAGRRIRNSLVLSEIARTEEILVDDSDLEAQINERAERAKVSPAAVRAFLEKNNQIAQVRDQALTEKILAFLKEESHITEKSLTREEMEALDNALPELTAQAEDEAAAATTFDSNVDVPASPLALEETAPKARRAKKDAGAEVEPAESEVAETAEPATETEAPVEA